MEYNDIVVHEAVIQLVHKSTKELRDAFRRNGRHRASSGAPIGEIGRERLLVELAFALGKGWLDEYKADVDIAKWGSFRQAARKANGERVWQKETDND